MNKSTLSNYGRITICILVLSVMIVMATHFGKSIGDNFKSISKNLYDINSNALQLLDVKSAPAILYHQVYECDFKGGTLEFVFHSDGAVDIFGYDSYCDYGVVFEPGSAIYGENEIQFDGATFIINEDGTISVSEYWESPLTLKLKPTKVSTFKMDTPYKFYGYDGSWFVYQFHSDGSVLYEFWEMEAGHVQITYPAGSCQYYDNHMQFDIVDYLMDVRCAIHPSGEKIIIAGNTFTMIN